MKQSQKKCKEGRSLYDILVNPNDFGQTVENLFHLSFLVKDGHVQISPNDGDAIVAPAHQPTAEDYAGGKAERKQCVVRLDFPFWQKMIAQKGIAKPFIEHRDYSPLLKSVEDRKKRVQQQREKAKQKQAVRDIDEGESDGEEPTTHLTKRAKPSTPKKNQTQNSQESRSRRSTTSRKSKSNTRVIESDSEDSNDKPSSKRRKK